MAPADAETAGRIEELETRLVELQRVVASLQISIRSLEEQMAEID